MSQPILLLMGSVRAGRRCPHIASWVQQHAAAQGLATERIDLKDWLLPPDDEPNIPATGRYTQPHTIAWSEKIAASPGFIFVSPQYNWGYPAPLKNALDHLYAEWHAKPVAFITYGGHGGTKCADQLRQIAQALELKPTSTAPAISIPRDKIETGTDLTPQELQPFEASLLQALKELASALAP